MANYKVFVTKQLPQEAIDYLSNYADADIWKALDHPPRDEFKRRIKDADGILLWGGDDIDGDLMDAAPKLKVIANIAMGYNNIRVDEATRRGIRVSNTPGVVTDATADLAFGLLISIARRIPEMERVVHKGEWKDWGPLEALGVEVSGKTLGIVGMGRIGAAVAKRARGFNMRILYYNRRRRPDDAETGAEYIADLPTLLGMSDFVSVNCPLNEGTRCLIGAKEFACMKPGAIFINTARGAIVDQKALYQALVKKRIHAAALDVTEVEPISPDDPLLKLDNVLIVPHIGTQTLETGIKMSMLAAENLVAGLLGKPMPTCINCNQIK